MRGKAKPQLAKNLAKPKLIPQPNGKGALYAGGVPGHKGAGGRPPKEFKQWLTDLLDDPNVRLQAEQILQDKDHRAFPTIYGDAIDRIHGKPNQKIQHTINLDELIGANRHK